VDGGREAAQLEIHVIARRVVLVLSAVLAAAAPVARAQGRYVVAVGFAGSSRVDLVEFRPCIPAEGSDCGVRVLRTADAAIDSSVTVPPIVAEGKNKEAAASIVHGTLLVAHFGGHGRRRGRRIAADRGLEARALALSTDALYAFVTYTSSAPGVRPVVRMIDLSTQSSIAHADLPAQPAGIAIAASTP
jgi:hypothetical protein